MADKDGMERKVYLLPEDLVERVKSYQAECGLPSEVEAVRRLLSEALQARDSIDDIMKQVRAQFQKDRDLRSVARDVLSGHILVKKLDIEDHEIRFGLRNMDAGKITRKGEMETGGLSDDGWFRFGETWPKETVPPPKSTTQAKGSGWDAPGTDLDEEIPF